MKTLIGAAMRCSLIFLIPTVTYATSAEWDLNPISGDWNTAANWTPNAVPNGPADVATFGLSHTTDVSISADTEVNSITFTSAATNPYTITASDSPSQAFTLTLSGGGIINNSGVTQNFITAASLLSNTRIVFTNSATAGRQTVFTNKGSNSYNGGGGVLEFHDNSTAGSAMVINNGVTSGFGSGGFTLFFNTSSAANGTFINNSSAVSGEDGGVIFFDDHSTAANATFVNNGAHVYGFVSEGPTSITFSGSSTAANATIHNNAGIVIGGQGGVVSFFSNATAGNAIITNKGATVAAFGGVTNFFGNSTGGDATIINDSGMVSGASGGQTVFASQFGGPPTAGNASITNNGGTVNGAGGGETIFKDTSTAGDSTLIANSGTNGGEGGAIFFENNSSGGSSRVEVFGNGFMDISFRRVDPALTIGSIEGDGSIFLGRSRLVVGSNDLSTTFSGVLQDGGQNHSAGGSLIKIGRGTLVLSGANTYTGSTTVRRGVLQVDGSITSDTVVRGTIESTLAGSGTISGNVSNLRGRVSPGALGVPGTLTVVGNYTQAQYATLMIQIAGASTGQFSVLNVFGHANLNGNLQPILLNGFVPTIGDSFTFMNYASLTGAFSRILNQVFDHGTEQWSVIYQNNNAILTVEAHTPVSDQGSTFLCLTLGLLGLVAFGRQLAHD